jgi:hypothetical protein
MDGVGSGFDRELFGIHTHTHACGARNLADAPAQPFALLLRRHISHRTTHPQEARTQPTTPTQETLAS